MNREIKFRGRRLDNKEWVHGYFYNMPIRNIVASFILTNDFLEEFEHGTRDYDLGFKLWKDMFPIDKNTIGQFTGLHDKNGTPIYEGDIIKVVDCVKVVKYIQECCSFCFGNIETLKEPVFAKWGDLYNYHQINGTYWEEYKNEIEIIGNIHDNPELLK